MICLKSVSKVYKSRKSRQVRALNEVNLTLPEKGMVFLLGKSGSGKTTLLNLIGGLDMPSDGEIIVGDRSLSALSKDELDAFRNFFVGFVFQEYNLIEEENVLSNIELALSLQGRSLDLPLIESVLRRVDLVGSDGNTLENKRIGELSGGQKQRVAIARALVKDPKMILADEPTGALDSKTGDMLFSLLKELSKERLVVVVTHDRDNAEKYADRIVELADGKVIVDTDPASEETGFCWKQRRGRFPLRRAFKMGLRGLKYRPFRMVSSIILSFVCFALATLLVSFASVDRARINLTTAYENGFQIAKIGYPARIAYRAWFSEEQDDMIRSYTGKQEIARVYSYLPNALTPSVFRDMPCGDKYHSSVENPYIATFRLGYSVMEIDWETGEKDWNLTPDPRVKESVCRLPKEPDEIAITDYYANAMLRFGIYGYEETPKSVDDIIGKQVHDYTIVGVYSTEIPASFYEQYDREFAKDWTQNEPNLHALSNGASDTILCTIFVCKDLHETVKVSISKAAFVKLSGDIAKDLSFLKQFNRLDVEVDFAAYLEGSSKDFFKNEEMVRDFYGKPSFLTTHSNIIEEKVTFYDQLTSPPFASWFYLAMGVAFAFSVLLTMNFLNASLDSRKKELGILRAIGAKRIDLVKICLSESMSLAAIEFVLTLVFCGTACHLFNEYAKLSLLSVWGYPVLALLGLSFFVTLLATVIPVLRLTSKKPVEILKNA